MNDFYKLGLNFEIHTAIEECGYLEPTQIQKEAIPALLSGRDVLGKSNTGTGKTAAFGLPAIQMVDAAIKSPQILILSPTRELDLQISAELKKFAKYKEGIKITPVYGGESIENQIRLLKRGCNIVVGTPGRVMDHLRRKTLKMDMIRMVVLDEADEMLNMGFKEDIETILHYLDHEVQMALFSATMPASILKITEKFQHDPLHIEVASAQRTIDTVRQEYYECKRGKKNDALRVLLETLQPQLTMIFTNTKAMVDELVDELNGHDIKAIGLHGDMKQQVRTRVMNQFKQRNYPILIATDVAARGIDVDDIDLVVNYDIPQDYEYYIHRVGRTGRAGKSGKAITLVSGKSQLHFMRELSRYTKTHIEAKPLPSNQQLIEKNKQKYMEEVLKACSEEMRCDNLEIANELLSQGVAIESLVSALISMSYKPIDIDMSDVSEKKKSYKSFADHEAVTLHFNVGKGQQITPANLVAAISEYSHLSSDVIGRIDIKGSYSLVDIRKDAVNAVLDAMRFCHIRNYEVNVKKDENKGYKVVSKEKRTSRRKPAKTSSANRRTRSE